MRRVLSRLPDGGAGWARRGGCGRKPTAGIIDLITGGSGNAGGGTLGFGVQRQRQLHSGLPRGHQYAVHGAAGPRLCPRAGRRQAAQHALAAGLSDDEPRRADPVAAAIAARDIGPRQGAVESSARQSPPDVVFYTGCNILKTPHIALLCLDVLDLLGVDYEVMGGPGQCCGVYQFREGDFDNTARVSYTTIDGLASAGTSTVLSWCPSCQVQIGEVTLPSYEARFGARPFDLNPFLVFLADHADTLAPLMKQRVEKRVALHERPVLPAVQAAVRKLLSIIPGVELVEIDVPRVGTQANSLAVLPAFKRELVQRELAAVADAGVTTLATIYHACHRELCDVGDGRSFEVVNFMEILGEGLGLRAEDLYKRLKMIKDIDDIIVETSPLIAEHRLDLDTVRDALLQEFGAD